MKPKSPEKDYNKFIKLIKEAILNSRYKAAKHINKEMLFLYYVIGKLLSEKISAEKWGAKVLERISKDIQKEFKGIRGFSVNNLKNMRYFFESYPEFNNKKLLSAFSQTLSVQFKQTVSERIKNYLPARQETEISQTLSAQFNFEEFINVFFSIGFSHHILLLSKCIDKEERWFYMKKTVEHQWSYRVLEYQIESKLYKKKRGLQTNFKEKLPAKLRSHALDTFKDEYLLNFININENDDEKILENEIVNNIKNFLISLGDEFCFIGNQYRLTVDDEEFFLDLLFFHRKLRSLIAIDLKTGKFKPEYAGKMNFYLSVLDDKVKLVDENSSIGIILCKEKNNTIVEYAFRDLTKPMGVATYRLTKKLPSKYKKHLPDTETLSKLLKKK